MLAIAIALRETLMRQALDDLFLSHPRSVGESYLQHLFVALRFGVTMVVGGLACMVHGIFPKLCTSTGSQTVCSLYNRMVSHRRTAPDLAAQALLYEI
jgi:Family of unknown function (DUF6356)